TVDRVLHPGVYRPRLSWGDKSAGPNLRVGMIEQVPNSQLQRGGAQQYVAREMKQSIRRQRNSGLIERGIGADDVRGQPRVPGLTGNCQVEPGYPDVLGRVEDPGPGKVFPVLRDEVFVLCVGEGPVSRELERSSQSSGKLHFDALAAATATVGCLQRDWIESLFVAHVGQKEGQNARRPWPVNLEGPFVSPA